MRNSLYPFFWQHGEKHDVLKNYVEQICASGMKGLCIEARPHPDFVGDGWWKDLDCILSKARELNMKVWILDDSHFPTGFANGRIRSDYPQYLKTYLFYRRFDVQGPFTGARIDLKLLVGRIWDRPDFSEKILGIYMAQRTSTETECGDPVKEETMVEITDCMRMSDRLLTVDIPDGAWSIFVVFQTQKGGEEATKDYLNPLVADATKILIQEVYEPHYQHYKDDFGTTIQGFFSDEPRFGNAKGTEAAIGTSMVLPWRDGLEQELDFEPKFLPLLWVPAEGKERSIRYSYMDLVTRLYNDNFTKVLAEWCNEHHVWYLGHNIEDNGAHARLGYGTGHYFRGQKDMDFAGIDTIGGQIVPGMNYHHDAFNTGGSNGEFYHYALAKLASSAAHLDPKKQGRAMCEAFGAYGWNEGLKAMTWIANHLLVRGISYIVPHAFNPKKFPDWDCPPHFYAHGANPQFRYYHYFSDYVNRITYLFSGGRHSATVGILYPAELEWMGRSMPVEKAARQLTVNQIEFDIVSMDYLKQAQISDGTYSINGQSFTTLVIPYGEYWPKDLSNLVNRLAEAGVSIIVLDALPKEIDLSSVSNEANLPEVIPLHNLAGKLSAERSVILTKPEPDLVVGEYEKNKHHYYMLFNENIGHKISDTLILPERGNVSRYDAWTDTYYPVNNNCGIPLSLEAGETIILVVNKEEGMADSSVKSGEAAEELVLPEKWDVQYADSFSYPVFSEKVPTSDLCCIDYLEGWEQKAGTVRFSGIVKGEDIKFADIPSHACRSNKRWLLDLGEVYETAEVMVNGVSAGCRLCKPYRFDLTPFLKDGDNELAIEITNTLGTTLRNPVSHYMIIEHFGILGPVKLEMKSSGDFLDD